jgi:pyruvate/2-oxoglutarate dehydrogenase complex dihydrolipoamide acyltransferase (E2) component
LRKNAKRAAEAMIRKGTAPAVDYGIKPSDNGRFEIVWKIAKAAPTTDEVETEIAKASADRPAAASPTEAASQPAPAATEPATTDAAPQPASEAEAASQPPVAPEAAPALSEPAPIEWPHGTRVMVRKRKSWREATIISRLDPDLWRAEYTGGGSGMFREADIRAYDPERDATTAEQPRRAKATAPQNLSRSRYAIDPETITAGRLPQRAPVVTSAANPHYQKHFDRLIDLAKAGDWDGVRNYEVKGSNSYSKMVARYRQDLLAVHAASEAAP